MTESARPVAVLYADVSGSTKLYEEHGDTIARADIATCLEILARVVANYDGKVIKTIGDEVMSTFPNAVKAALAAIEMQESVSDAGDADRFQSGPLHIKIGWHFGPALLRGDDLIGEGPSVAQHVIKQARADEILTSGRTVEMLPDEMRERTHRIDRQDVSIEGMTQKIEICVIQWEEAEEVTQFGGGRATAAGPKTPQSLKLSCNGREARLDSKRTTCVIGRAANADLRVQGRYVSRHHVEIQFQNGNFHIHDQSANGTHIQFDDGRNSRLHREHSLLTGSGMIGIGEPPGSDPASTVTFKCN